MYKSVLSLLLTTSIIGITLSPTQTAAIDPKFRRPLDTILSPAFSAYYDHDTSANVKTYTCGTSTVYNGHQGTDFRATVGTNIFAAAKGGLYYRYDACDTIGYRGSTCGGGYGNHVRIDHEGSTTDGAGWVTVYAHMKKGTPVGLQTLYCSTKVGQTGQSGNADGPHLHFEVKKYGYPNNDPFSGQCSGSTSFWLKQSNGTPTTECQAAGV